MKKVLFIAYFFPPAGGGGVQRSLKFAKYLVTFGWNSRVISAGIGQTDLIDKTLEKDIPKQVKVYHVNSFDPHILFRQGQVQKNINQVSILIRIKSLIRRIGKFILAIFFIPDEFVFWILPAYLKSSKVILAERPQVILSTSGPVSSHLVAYLLKRKYHLPWIADLRDEWADNPYKTFPTPIHRWLDLKIEKVVLSKADRIVSVTDRIRKSLEKRLGKKVDTIFNGYDEEDAIPDTTPKNKNQFEITFTGSFYEAISPRDVLQVLSEIVDEKKIKRDSLKLNFIGKISVEVLKDITPFKNKLNINMTGYVSHDESLRWLGEASTLLLITKRRGSLTGKVFEYINSKKPILAYVPRGGEVDQLLRGIGAKWVIRNGDKTGLKSTILSMYNMWVAGKLKNSYSVDTDQFSRKELTRKLSELLNEVTK